MKSLATGLAFAVFVAALGPVPAANAARRYAPNYAYSRGSSQCYPYCPTGPYYKGRPLSEWLKPDGW